MNYFGGAPHHQRLSDRWKPSVEAFASRVAATETSVALRILQKMDRYILAVLVIYCSLTAVADSDHVSNTTASDILLDADSKPGLSWATTTQPPTTTTPKVICHSIL